MAERVLGIDLGTSAVKVALVDRQGAVLAGEREPYPMYDDTPGAMEQEPRDWTRALAAAVHRLGARSDLGRVGAIGLAGQLPTLTRVRDGEPHGRAVTWLDGRADAWTRRRLGPGRRENFYRRTGMPLDGRYIGPMYAYHGGREADRTDRVMSAKDYLYLWLTGEARTDPATAAGYGAWDLTEGRWLGAALTLWSLDAAQLPAVVTGRAAFAPLRAESADDLGLPRGVPVHVGSADSLAAVVGAGAFGPRSLAMVFGSSTALVGSVDAPVLDGGARYLVTPHALPGRFAVESDLLATGAALDWLASLAGWAPGRLVTAAGLAPLGAAGVRFAPYLAGAEQGGLWRTDVAGAVLGLTTSHTLAHLGRALLEGIAFETRRSLELLAEPMGGVDEVVVLGLGDGDWFAAALADVVGRAVVHVPGSLTAARGAALLTGETDFAPDEARPIRASAGPGVAAHPPTAAGSALYEGLYREHLRLFPRRAATGRGGVIRKPDGRTGAGT